MVDIMGLELKVQESMASAVAAVSGLVFGAIVFAVLLLLRGWIGRCVWSSVRKMITSWFIVLTAHVLVLALLFVVTRTVIATHIGVFSFNVSPLLLFPFGGLAVLLVLMIVAALLGLLWSAVGAYQPRSRTSVVAGVIAGVVVGLVAVGSSSSLRLAAAGGAIQWAAWGYMAWFLSAAQGLGKAPAALDSREDAGKPRA
jgi:hypothetical protein